MRLREKEILGYVVLINLFVICMARIHVPTIDWVVKETSITRFCSTKKILTINGEFPGPALHLHRGERLKVNVLNHAKYNLTIHWHGVKQPRNPWSDGPEYVTQCPIQPGSNYTYEIILSDEEGTLWWHAHSDWSRATVYGPIFIYPKFPSHYPFPTPTKEIPIILGSWYKKDVMELIQPAVKSGADVNKSDAFTINGQPGDTHPCSRLGMFKMMFDYRRTYLLRIINAVMNENMFFMIANHKLTVVAIDAAYIKPIITNYIMITPGQTMDVLVTANQRPSHYYMAARAFGEFIYSNATTTALVLYTVKYTSPSKPSFPTLPYYNNTNAATSFTRRFRALADKKHLIDVPKIVHNRLIMTIAVGTKPCDLKYRTCQGPSDRMLTANMNNITFLTPKIDVLQAYYKHIKGVYEIDFPDKPKFVFNYTEDPMLSITNTMTELNGTKVRVLEYNTSVEIVWQNANVMNSSENHPMHLHGYSFYVVGFGFGNFNKKIHPKGYNLIDPPLVNTIGVPKNGWVAIRFRADNPGVWFMHCHLERHSSWGMDTVLIVKNGPTRSTSIRPPHYINPC